jgi:hypothetical protein
MLNFVGIYFVLYYFFFAPSCNEIAHQSYYKYGDFTLVREEDDDAHIRLYIYGEKENYITVHPRGFNGVVEGYIFFNSDHINVCIGEGATEQEGETNKLQLTDFDTNDTRSIDEKQYNLQHQGSLMCFSMYVRSELIRNGKVFSKVQAIYDTILLRQAQQ